MNMVCVLPIFFVLLHRINNSHYRHTQQSNHVDYPHYHCYYRNCFILGI